MASAIFAKTLHKFYELQQWYSKVWQEESAPPALAVQSISNHHKLKSQLSDIE